MPTLVHVKRAAELYSGFWSWSWVWCCERACAGLVDVDEEDEGYDEGEELGGEWCWHGAGVGFCCGYVGAAIERLGQEVQVVKRAVKRKELGEMEEKVVTYGEEGIFTTMGMGSCEVPCSRCLVSYLRRDGLPLVTNG